MLPLKRVRGNRKAIQEFAEAFRTATGDEPGLRVGIAHADAPERMAAVEKLVRDIRPNAEDRGRDDARPGRRHTRRPGHGRALLAPGLTQGGLTSA